MSVEIGVKQNVSESRLPMQQNVETHENSVKFHIFVHILAAILTLTDHVGENISSTFGNGQFYHCAC